MTDKDCLVISTLWIQLNPHCSVEGCEVDGAGTVHLWIWYSRGKKKQPLELVIGNPPRAVIRGLKKALGEMARADRLTNTHGAKIVDVREDSQKTVKIEI